jgi:nitrogen fixation protein FixH
MSRIQNAHDLKEKPLISYTDQGVEIVFPSALDRTKVMGNVLLYRPSNKKFDFTTPLTLANSSSLLIAKNKLIKGRWDVQMEWQYEGLKYLSKEVIYVK